VASEYGYGGLVQNLGGLGLGLMFLKFGRDDERQADDLGVRYMLAENYDPRGMVTMFETLERIGQESGSTIPTWQSTHPAPENRRERARALLAEIDRPLDTLHDDRDRYLARIDGIVYGENPREGFFDGTTFHHPEMAFRIDFPAGWKTSNTRAAVAGASPEQDALLQLGLVPQDDLEEASKAFFGKHAVTPGDAWLSEIGGEPAVSREFTAANADRSLAGTVAWVRHDDRTVQMLALAEGSRWSARRDALRSALASFRRETDPKVLDVRPAVVRVVTLSADMTVSEAARRERDVHERLDRILTLNGMSEDRTLARGSKIKLPVGGPPRAD
jgi:predicted Zn-dependent protease